MSSTARAALTKLADSAIYRDYERAFSLATGLPLSLRGGETAGLVHHGKEAENPFCRLMASASRSCAACLEVQEALARGEGVEPKTVVCFAGLCDTAVPIRSGQALLGYLQTGQVMVRKPTREQFRRVTKQLLGWGLQVDLKRVEEAYFHSRVIPPEQYEAVIRLLTIFAQHLAAAANQITVQERTQEPVQVMKAREFIEVHQAEDLSLDQVAAYVHTSTYYFCKLFKRATGMTFTEYLTRVRIEKARALLANRQKRVSEIAFEVGFQSLSQFNRAFLRICGQSPSQYRSRELAG
ncbi:MAG: helix-turn-helix domain-containing protein [Verrucomicrobiia bacterium]